MNRVCLFIIFVSSIVIGYSQKTAKVSATYTYYAPETMSVEEAKRIALDRAKIQAIADEFGTIVSQSTSTVVTSKNGVSDTQFFALAGSNVKGEWIETTMDPQFVVSFEDQCVVIFCELQGVIRECIPNNLEVEVLTLKNSPNINFTSTEFMDGDDLYLYFKSPVSGYLNVYLINDIEHIAYCLLPYKNDPNDSYYIKADTDYYLFSKDKAVIDSKVVDEYTLTAFNNVEFNDIVIVFSSSKFSKSSLKIEKNGNTPKRTSLSKFNNWLAKLKLKYQDITTTQITITINRK